MIEMETVPTPEVSSESDKDRDEKIIELLCVLKKVLFIC